MSRKPPSDKKEKPPMTDSATALGEKVPSSSSPRSGRSFSPGAAGARNRSRARGRAGSPGKQDQPTNGDRTPRTTRHEDDQELWKVFKRTRDINLRNVLVEKYFPLVRYIAERVLQTLPRSIELDDLVSAGLFGLFDAIEGFDLKRGIKFKTYCSTRIRGAILDELRTQDWVPRLVRLKAHRVEKAVRDLESEFGREPTAFELAEKLGVAIDEVSQVLSEAAPKTIFSLSEKWDDGEDDRDMEKVDVIEDKRTPNPQQILNQKDVLRLITSHLTRKERLILVMYYYEGLTMREIGDILELTESRVCQIHSNIMQRLKVQLKRAQATISG